MPYIDAESRRKLERESPSTPGELNYAITCVVVSYLRRRGLSYTTINDIVGALEGAKAEFNRRIAAPYEDRKIKENGDVF